MKLDPMHNKQVRFRRINGRVVPVSLGKQRATNQAQGAVNAYDYAKGAAGGVALALGSKLLKRKKIALAFAGATGLTVGVRAYNSRDAQQFGENFTTGLVKKGIGFVAAGGATYGALKLRRFLK